MKINVKYIPSKAVAVWTFPTIYNRLFDKTQTLFWQEVPPIEDYDPYKDYTDADDYSWVEE